MPHVPASPFNSPPVLVRPVLSTHNLLGTPPSTGLLRAPGIWEIKGLLLTYLELLVLLSSESGNQMTTNGDEERSHTDEASRASPNTGFFWVWSSFPTSFHIPSRLLDTRKLHTMSNCSHSKRHVAAMSEANTCSSPAQPGLGS